jgi:cytochrome c biogenesis protein CcmG, thiol:disulfide interchange protein DsbE
MKVHFKPCNGAAERFLGILERRNNLANKYGETESSRRGGVLVPNLTKYRVLLLGIFSPLLALVLNVILIQILLAVTYDPENNWRFRLLVSSLVLPLPFLLTLLLATKDRRRGALSLSAKIGLAVAALSLLLIAKPVMDGLLRSKQSRNMAMHDVPAPMFDTVDIQGKPQRLSDYKGKVVLVNIWATWCEPCRKEMPQLDKLYRSRKASGFVVLGISDEAIETQQAFLKQVSVTYPLLTATSRLPPFYREIAKYPAIFLIDREGRLQPAPSAGQPFAKIEATADALLARDSH